MSFNKSNPRDGRKVSQEKQAVGPTGGDTGRGTGREGEEGGGGKQGVDGDRENPEVCKNAEREVAGMDQQLKEGRRGLTNNQEKAAMASMEERDALVRRGNACQETNREAL